MERAVIIARGSEIEPGDLRDEVLHPERAVSSEAGEYLATQLDLSRGISFYDEVSRFQIELIRRALQITGGHQSRAAKLLGMNTTTLNSKIRYYNIRP
jgi:DNA-binding NtrC family response regulator